MDENEKIAEEMEEEMEETIVEDEKKSLKKIPKIKMPEEQAREEWKNYVGVLKKRKEKYLRIMKEAMYQMKKGRELIDIYKVMKEIGLNTNNEPRLAIARADVKDCIFEKRDSGTGVLGNSVRYGGVEWDRDRIELPQNTFKIQWEREKESSWSIAKKLLRTKVPIVPVELLPEGSLSNYYILWETSDWEALPETKDPILLKRISENLFAILGTWDLTPLEQSVIAGGK